MMMQQQMIVQHQWAWQQQMMMQQQPQLLMTKSSKPEEARKSKRSKQASLPAQVVEVTGKACVQVNKVGADAAGTSADGVDASALGEDGRRRPRRRRWDPIIVPPKVIPGRTLPVRQGLVVGKLGAALARRVALAVSSRAARAAPPNMGPEPAKVGEGGTTWEEPRAKTGLQLLGDLAPATMASARLNYILADEPRRSFVSFLPGLIAEDACSAFFATIRDGTNWMQPCGPLGPIPRKTAWFVSRGCSCCYRYGGVEVAPCEYPAWMSELMQVVMPACGVSQPSEMPNCCNLNLYEDGGMSVGWHSDDEALFQGKFRDCRIISLSFGAKRRFELRLNWPQEGEQFAWHLMLGNGDVCTMEGMTQKHFQHRVAREANVSGARVNLTWRWIVKHTPHCPASRERLF